MKRFVLIVWLSFASFTVGTLLGFLFSSFGEENVTLGKIRDWLVGAITALTVAKAATIKNLLLVFAADAGPTEFAFTVAAAISYCGLGFFFMFFQRELILNVLLAQSRAERNKLEGSQEATNVIQQFLTRLPASVLTGVNDISDYKDDNKSKQKDLENLLYSEDVNKFLEQAGEAAKRGAVDWDITSKSAYIWYYRSFFKDPTDPELDKAIEWIARALNMNPLHADLTMKYAAIPGRRNECVTAATILERLVIRPDAPLLVRQWLGAYLRSVPDRLDDAIRYSKEYLTFFPGDVITILNIAYAYALKYWSHLQKSGKKEDRESQDRQNALSALREAFFQDKPVAEEKVRTQWIKNGSEVEFLADDSEFRTLTGLDQPIISSTESPDKNEKSSRDEAVS